MKHPLKLALTAALCLGIAAPAPAHADAEDAAKIIAGLAALVIIGKALEGAESHPQPQSHPPKPHHPPRPPKPDHRHKVIPAACYQEMYRPGGSVAKGYGARCMERRVSRPHLLPTHCATPERTVRGLRVFYSPKCLAQNGWVGQNLRHARH